MIFAVKHTISNPEEFWKVAKEQTQNLPTPLKLHGIYPSKDTKSGTCLWEANNVQEVQQYLDKYEGKFAKNFCYEVNVKESVGLPVFKTATVFAN